MSGRHPISTLPVLYDMPELADVTVEHNDVFDLYRTRKNTPVVIIVGGFPDRGFQKIVGCRFREMQSTISWARLIAASGLTAVTYANEEPERDLHAILRTIREKTEHIGLWASSGNVPLALSLLMRDGREDITCAALCYGYTLDVDEQAKAFGFVNPCAGKSVEDLRRDVPLFIARAGRDEMPRLNETLDRFVCSALSENLPITVANHADGPHSFDLLHDSDTTRSVIRQVLTFLVSR
jgi:hypothetical protein